MAKFTHEIGESTGGSQPDFHTINCGLQLRHRVNPREGQVSWGAALVFLLFRDGERIDEHTEEVKDDYNSPEDAIEHCVELVGANGYLRQIIRGYSRHFGVGENKVVFDASIPHGYHYAIFNAITGPSEWKE